MKKMLLIFVIILCSTQLYSAEPLVKFYLQDGSTKQYNLSDIDNMKIPNAPDSLQLQVFTNNGKTFYYPAQLIDSMKFSIIPNKNQFIDLWHDGFNWSFSILKILKVDSILFYYTPYTAVTIGTQHWMYKNLNVDHYRNGDSIPEVKNPTEWANLKTGAWIYSYDYSNGSYYGKLYNWFAVSDPRGLAPAGWHISSCAELRFLSSYLGGESVAGGKLKEAGTSHWYSTNSGATNESGFSALPGGHLNYYSSVDNIGDTGTWWSSTEYDTSQACGMDLNSYYANVLMTVSDKRSGYSVRCVRD